MKIIQASTGQAILVDDEDYDYLSQWTWRAYASLNSSHKTMYATTSEWNGEKKYHVSMQHLILGRPQEGYVVDHIDGNGLNNQRSNLRLITHSQNMMRQRKTKKPKKSKYKGVFKEGAKYRKNPYRAYIYVEGKRINIGSYSTEREAAEAYDKTAKKCFKEYARVNFKE